MGDAMGRQRHGPTIIASYGLYTLYTPNVPTASLHPTLARAAAALERGRGTEAAPHLSPLLRTGSLNREDELTVRGALAEAWLLQDDLVQATTALGRPPDSPDEKISDA